MKALVLKDYNHLEIDEVPSPSIGNNEVLVRVKAAGICGSDVHGMDGSSGRRIPPVIMGHEASGTIAEIGADVTAWQEGDRVTFDSTIYCGECAFCRRGDVNLCENRRVLGVSCDAYRQNGAFAEFVAVPERILHRLPPDVSFEHAAMVEPCSVAVHAVERTPVSLGDTAVVVGTGMIGLLVVQALRTAGCGRIIAVDIQPTRLQQALDLGADEGLNPNEEDVTARIQAETDGLGADLSCEVVGMESTFDLALRSVRKGGAVTLIGNLSPSVTFPMQFAVTRELTLYGSCASSGEYPACLELMSRGAIDVEPLISAVAPLEEGAEWFQRLYDGESELMKVILKP